MDALVRLSFYSFAAATLAFVLAALCYLAYAVGRVRVRRMALATSAGASVVGHETSLEPASANLARFGTMLAWL